MTSVRTSPTATRVAPLPSIPVVRTDNPALNQCLEAIRTHLEVRQGDRGNPWERVVTLRDLQALGVAPEKLEALAKATTPGSGRVPTAGSGVAVKPEKFATDEKGLSDAEVLAREILNTQLFRNLSRRLDDATRFDFLPQIMQAALTNSISQEALARGADIRRVETIVRDGAFQFAQQIEEVTAALQSTAAGVREVASAYADGDRAVASKVTQVEARLGVAEGDLAAVEVVASAVADRATGLEAQYTVKVQAGGAIAGIGLAASAPVGGTPSSAVIIQADKFALVQPGYSGGMTNTPASWRVPFSVDTANSKVVVNGDVVVSGDLLAGGTITSTNIDTTGRIKAEGNSAAYSGLPALRAAIFAVNPSSSSYNFGYGLIAYSLFGTGMRAQGSVYGVEAEGSQVGVRATAFGSSPARTAVFADSNSPTNEAAALHMRGRMLWQTSGGYVVSWDPPPNTSTQFLRADGQWASPGGGSGVSSFNGRTGTVTLTGGDVGTAVAGSTLAVNITGDANSVGGLLGGNLIARGGSSFTLTVPGVGTWSGCTVS